MILPPNEMRDALVTCRAGLERVVADELEALGLSTTQIGNRAVFFQTDLAGIYRANMALRCALNVLVPLRTFNARTYELLYFQSRKTNWHKLFPVDTTIRIDVNGGSNKLTNTQYVVHRVKDGIVDTFRKLSGGKRPSISKDNPDIHIVVHLDGTEVTVCLDTSGTPLFKRGYRIDHGVAPLKEDLAAGMLKLSDWDEKSPLLDPMCGSGTFLFEGWMIAAKIPPNLDRKFGFESIFDYNEDLHDKERQQLADKIDLETKTSFYGIEKDEETFEVMENICMNTFPNAPFECFEDDFRNVDSIPENTYIISNPPYGIRSGAQVMLAQLYKDLGELISSKKKGAAIFTANDELKSEIGLKPNKELTLFNGALEGRLIFY